MEWEFYPTTVKPMLDEAFIQQNMKSHFSLFLFNISIFRKFVPKVISLRHPEQRKMDSDLSMLATVLFNEDNEWTECLAVKV